MKIKFSILVLLALTGCATTPVPTASARFVSVDRVLSEKLLERKDGQGQVIIKRDEGMTPICNTRVFANGIPVADLAPGEKVVFYLPEGEQLVGAVANGLCAGGLVETRASVSRLRPAVFRVSYGSDGEFLIQPTAF